MHYRISVVLVLLFSAVLLSEEPATKAFGKNFGLITNMIGRANATPSDLLREESIQVELGLSEQQVADLEDLTVGASAFPDALALAGLNQKEDQESSSVDVALRALREHQSVLEKKVRKFLTPKQYQRMKQIFNQKMLLSGRLDQVTGGIDASTEEIAKLNRSLHESRGTLVVEVQKIKWRLYLKAFDEVVGEGTSRKAFGRPFYLDVEYDDSEEETTNRRREQ